MENYNFDKLKAFSENKQYHVILNDNQMEQFKLLCSLLIEKNKQVNLTAITDPQEIEVKHFIDSLMAVNAIKKHSEGERFSLIDIGSGAGFPGLPLKIEFPGAEFVLVDSVGKKTAFINEAVEKLGLTKIAVETERAEKLAFTQYREQFDFCTARAVADMSVLLEYCLPFLRVGGYCIFYKSGAYENELAGADVALSVLGGEVDEVISFTLPFSTSARSLILVKKISETPSKYPRKTGKPEKSPLGKK